MRLKQQIARHLCAVFGCNPTEDPAGEIRCSRCANKHFEYEELVGDTPWGRFKDRLVHWGWRRWVPTRCPDCGKRYGKHEHCLPF